MFVHFFFFSFSFLFCFLSSPLPFFSSEYEIKDAYDVGDRVAAYRDGIMHTGCISAVLNNDKYSILFDTTGSSSTAEDAAVENAGIKKCIRSNIHKAIAKHTNNTNNKKASDVLDEVDQATHVMVNSALLAQEQEEQEQEEEEEEEELQPQQHQEAPASSQPCEVLTEASAMTLLTIAYHLKLVQPDNGFLAVAQLAPVVASMALTSWGTKYVLDVEDQGKGLHVSVAEGNFNNVTAVQQCMPFALQLDPTTELQYLSKLGLAHSNAKNKAELRSSMCGKQLFANCVQQKPPPGSAATYNYIICDARRVHFEAALSIVYNMIGVYQAHQKRANKGFALSDVACLLMMFAFDRDAPGIARPNSVCGGWDEYLRDTYNYDIVPLFHTTISEATAAAADQFAADKDHRLAGDAAFADYFFVRDHVL